METSKKIRHFSSLLEQSKGTEIKEWVPSYIALTIYYDPYKITYQEIKTRIEGLWRKLEGGNVPLAKRMVRIPVCYGGEFGPDLEYIANFHSLSIEEVISIHTQREYFVYMLGFNPGFPYLGGMNKKIATPRLSTPRAQVIEGSVGIAGEQTGIYPLTSPGGWQIIGRTPMRLFAPEKQAPFLLKSGDYLIFQKITKEEYLEMVRNPCYKVEERVVEDDGEN